MAFYAQVSFASMALAMATPPWPRMRPPPPTRVEVPTGEIIVTAQKRSERLQSVPVSIQAVEASTLKKMAIQSPRNLARSRPRSISGR
jgi:iron complex outermembrane receptor protein